MKGKLHKMVSGYILSLNGDIDDPYAIVNKELAEDYEWHKLSLKNCQIIELDCDLDGVVNDIVKTIVPDDRGEDIWYGTSMAIGKLCFQKALELLGDKKFSEEDVISMIEKSKETGLTAEYLILTKQKREWDVEIEVEEKWIPGTSTYGHGEYELVPKLDADGCLILKKYKNG